MSFLGTSPTPPAAEEPPLANDDWFPDIDLRDLRETCRLDGTVTPQRLRHAALDAMASVNAELRGYEAAQRLAGWPALAEVPSPQIAGESVQLQRYRRAVYATVQAELVERYRDFDTTGSGDKAAEKLELRIDELRRDRRWAISGICGRPQSTVELI